MTQLDLEDAITAAERRDRALALHEKKAAGRRYLAQARAMAQLICREKGSATVNDVRAAIGDPPKECSPTIMGAVFKDSVFAFAGYEKNPRTTCHARPIARFRLKEEAA